MKSKDRFVKQGGQDPSTKQIGPSELFLAQLDIMYIVRKPRVLCLIINSFSISAILGQTPKFTETTLFAVRYRPPSRAMELHALDEVCASGLFLPNRREAVRRRNPGTRE